MDGYHDDSLFEAIYTMVGLRRGFSTCLMAPQTNVREPSLLVEIKEREHGA
jgi:hypothetical protein